VASSVAPPERITTCDAALDSKSMLLGSRKGTGRFATPMKVVASHIDPLHIGNVLLPPVI